MSPDRTRFKQDIVGIFDAAAEEHPLGHQPAKGNRYMVQCPGGTPIELMFEKNAESSTNIWCLAIACPGPHPVGLEPEHYPASETRLHLNKKGKLNYGRHEALRTMPQLGDADLLCFRIDLDRFDHVKFILEALQDASRRNLRP